MTHFYKLICILCFFFYDNAFSQAQDDGALFFMGRNYFNDKELGNTKVTVKCGSTTIYELQTRKDKSDFKVELPFGKVYDIYLTNPQCQNMFLRVIADNVPENKRAYFMNYELKIPFFPKNDYLIDTNQFNQPFHRIVFNGKQKFVDDTAYMHSFMKNIYKQPVIEDTVPKVIAIVKPKELVQLVGKICIDNDKQTPLKNKPINLIGIDGNIISSSQTNNYGRFTFPNVDEEKVKGISIIILSKDNPSNQNIKLTNNSSQLINSKIYVANTPSEFNNSDSINVINRLTDNGFKYDIAGKLIATNGVEKKIASNKIVYLLGEKNEVLKTTSTDALGNFVFSEINPWKIYSIGFDTTSSDPHFKMDLYSTKDKFIRHLDSMHANKFVYRFLAVSHSEFNDLIADETELRMNVKGKLHGDNKSNPLSGFKVLLLNDKFETIDSSITNKDGCFIFNHLSYSKQYSISAENNDNSLNIFSNILLFDNVDHLVKLVSLEKGKRFHYKLLAVEQSSLSELYVDDAWLSIINKNKKLKTENIVESILFEFSKADLLLQSKQTLDKVVLAMQSNSNFTIELIAHSDSKGSDAYNLKLSEQRATAAKNYIVSNHIDSKRIIAKGYGETKLINNCGNVSVCSEDEHAVNRRLEFKLFFN